MHKCKHLESKLLMKNKELKQLKQQLRRDAVKLDNMRTTNILPVGDTELLIERKGKQRLSSRGILAVAIRRNVSSVAAFDFGCVSLDPISGQTVIRAELLLGSCLTAASKYFQKHAWHELNMAWTDSHQPDDKWRAIVYSFRSDATNSCIWQNAKLAGTQTQIYT